MGGNTFGVLFRLTTFGESHGFAIGGVIDGCPSGVVINNDLIQKDLNRRRPGFSDIGAARMEKDQLEIISGIFQKKTTGTPIAFFVRNKDAKSEDYDSLKDIFRPSHADYTYDRKYAWRDHRGGGRASARETLARVVAGSIAKQILHFEDIEIKAYVNQIGTVMLKNFLTDPDFDAIEKSPVRCPDESTSRQMIELIKVLKEKGDSTGGMITCKIKGVPAGLGEPVFDKIHAELGKAMLSINAAKGFEIGSGFAGISLRGSEHNDEFAKDQQTGKIYTRTNFSGGVQGGITNGQQIDIRIAFKPVASISTEQETVDKDGAPAKLKIKGRHDVCVVPRAVPVVEAMAALVIMDQLLRYRAYIKQT